MKRILAGQLLLLCFLASAALAAETISPPALESYYKISEALAADTLIGVAENAKLFAAAVKDPALQLAATNVAAATQVDLARTRDMFKFMSSVFTNGIKFGDYQLAQGTSYRVFCPMKKAEWLQASKAPIHNPYHGSEMLTCGEVMETYEAKP
jgi:hypothetical protein